MCVSFVRRMENMLKYLGPDIRVHNLKKKIVNYLLPFLRLNVPCPFAYSKLFQPTLEANVPLRPGSSYSPKAEGSLLFVGEREICPSLMSQEFDSCTQLTGSVKTVL